MIKAARISLLLAAVVVTVAAVAAAAVRFGWYDAVANRVGPDAFRAASATRPAADAPSVNETKGPQRVAAPPAAVSKTAMTPEKRFERLVEGVIDLAIEEVGEQMRGQETADVETRRQCDQRREEVCRKRRAMYVVFSQGKEG